MIAPTFEVTAHPGGLARDTVLYKGSDLPRALVIGWEAAPDWANVTVRDRFTVAHWWHGMRFREGTVFAGRSRPLLAR
jgi:hypothetical protein